MTEPRERLAGMYPELGFREVNAIASENGLLLPDIWPAQSIAYRAEQAEWKTESATSPKRQED